MLDLTPFLRSRALLRLLQVWKLDVKCLALNLGLWRQVKPAASPLQLLFVDWSDWSKRLGELFSLHLTSNIGSDAFSTTGTIQASRWLYVHALSTGAGVVGVRHLAVRLALVDSARRLRQALGTCQRKHQCREKRHDEPVGLGHGRCEMRGLTFELSCPRRHAL